MERDISETDKDEIIAKYPIENVGVQKGHAPNGDLKKMLSLLGGRPVEPLNSPQIPLPRQIAER